MVRTLANFCGFFSHGQRDGFSTISTLCSCKILPSSQPNPPLYSRRQGTACLSWLSNTMSGTTSLFPISLSDSTFPVFCFLRVNQQQNTAFPQMTLSCRLLYPESTDSFFNYSRADATRQSVTVQVIGSSVKKTNYLLNSDYSRLNGGGWVGSNWRTYTSPLVWCGSFSGESYPLAFMLM